MKQLKLLKATLLAAVLLLLQPMARGQVQDSVDVLDYDVTLDLSAEAPFGGRTLVTARLLRPCDGFRLYLRGTADSVFVNGNRLAEPSLNPVPLQGIATGETFTVEVFYHCNGYVENYGWGGVHFDSDMSFNLGVGFETNPHVLGRVMMPCRDNFQDKATYTLRIKSKSG